MPQETQEHIELKEFLLGAITLEEAREKVEQRLMLDEEYLEDMLAVEEELIQNYVDGKLSPAEKLAFEKNFLISAERRGRVKFARAFRTYVDAQDSPQRTNAPVKEGFSFAKIFSFSPMFGAPVAVALVIAVFFSSFLIWNWYTNYSASQQAMASLNKAFKQERPLESRIAGLDYAPFERTRAGGEPPVDKLELNRAERQILDNAAEDPTAANLLSLGRLYLVKKDFDNAVEQLERAHKLDPKNPAVLSDLGAAYLEKGRMQEDGGAKVELFAQASKKLDDALALDPNLPAARFNKARYLELLSLTNQAKEAWREYLKLDQTSGWAEEARQHLEKLEKQTAKEMTADELEQTFLSAARDRNDAEAFRVVSQNRELIEKKYLPQKLAMSFLEAGDDRKAEIGDGLRFLGKLEAERNKDNFAADIAAFYSSLSPEKIAILKKAQAAMQEGYKLCLKDKYNQALAEFTAAQALFLKAGDIIEAKTISAYFIGYCLFQDHQFKAAAGIFKQIDEFSTQKNYQWFALMNLGWVIAAEEALGYLLSTDVRDRYLASLKKAEDMGDLYLGQKYVCSLASRNSSVKQDEKNFAYLQKIFEYSGKSNVSPRQKIRGFNSAVKILASGHFNALSEGVVRESIASREADEGPVFVINDQKNFGNIYLQAKNFPEAEKWLLEAKSGAEVLEEETQRRKTSIDILVNLGNLEGERGNYDRAVAYYNESLQLNNYSQGPQGDDIPPWLYETRKSRLFAYQALGDDERIEKDLPAIINFAEVRRKKIDNEGERNSFFNYEQQVYDIAIEHEFRKGRTARAFDYAETSNSRSLLDWLQKGVKISGNNEGRESHFSEPADPLTADEIRERMPAEVQILQYAVLKDKTLIWIISRDNFVLVQSEIKGNELEAKIKSYLDKVRQKDAKQQEEANEMSREFYGALIEPALPYLDKGREICIVPNKSLFYLPYAALRSPGGNYFVQEFDFFYSPSANVFIFSTGEGRKRGSAVNESLLSVGNPAFDERKLPGLKDLPESAAEAGEIAGNYDRSQILLGKDATKDAFRRAMKNAEVIHFAGHYVVHPEAPLLSELVMAKNSDKEEDSFFTNAELKNEELPRAKLVVLSACQTGVEGYYNGEGLIGLSRTFLSLGVPVVVASGWPVDSDATAELMKNFHQYRRQEKLSTVKALRKAQLEMVNAPDSRYRAAYYWAAFAAFGGHTEF